ncbi:MAG: GNAT family N-acetyltransferase [Pleurocapsa sp. MO_192.B19]|nr:GNAT family N-acetyltransferase [Pleurocapsa sp. MO_192.B19]
MSKLPQIIETSRLKLRSPSLQDAPAIFEQYAQDKQVTKYMTWQPHQNVETTQKFVQRCIDALATKTDFYWVILPKKAKKAVGMIRLQHQNYHTSLGYVLARPYWNQGLMTEALQPLVGWAITQPDIYRVWAVCDCENLASARVLEKVGMTREGILRRWLIHPNLSDKPRDCFCYAKVK